MGNPNTAISLILKKAEGSATYAIFRLGLLLDAIHSAIMKLKAQPQPPRKAKVSRNVLEKISVGTWPASKRDWFTETFGSNNLLDTASSVLVPWTPKNQSTWVIIT